MEYNQWCITKVYSGHYLWSGHFVEGSTSWRQSLPWVLVYLGMWQGEGLVLHVPIKIDYERQPKGRTIRRAEVLIKEKGRDRIGHSENNIMCTQVIIQQKALEILLEFTKVVVEILIHLYIAILL